MAWALVAHALVLGVGVVLTIFLWPGMRGTTVSFWGRALLLGPLGVVLQFLLQVLLGLPFHLASVAWVWGGLAVLALLLRFKRKGTNEVQGGKRHPRSGTLFLMGGLLFALSAGVAMRQPIHEGDALTNYALPARLFAEAKGVPFEALNDLHSFGHVEYPPLLAASEALVFQAAGEKGYLWNQLFGPLALLALFFLLAGFWFEEDPLPFPFSWLLLGVFMGTPLVLFQGSLGVADLRLLASLLLLGVEARRLGSLGRWQSGTAFLLLFLGLLCAFTKVEGGLGLLVVALLLWKWRKGFGLGRLLGPGFLTLGFWILWPLLLWANGVSLFQSSGWGWEKESVGMRLRVLANYVGDLPLYSLPVNLSGWLGWPGAFIPAWGLLWVFVPYLMLRFLIQSLWQRKKEEIIQGAKNLDRFFAGMFLFHLSLFFLVFLFTPREIQWHLNTAGERFLLLTLAWPLLLVPSLFGASPAVTSCDRHGLRGRDRASHEERSQPQTGDTKKGERS